MKIANYVCILLCVVSCATKPTTESSGIDREGVRRVIRSHLTQVKACYERGLKINKEISGKLVVEFEVGRAGVVKKAMVKETTLNNPEIENCIVDRLKEWIFPEPPEGVVAVVVYPFSFTAQK